MNEIDSNFLWLHVIWVNILRGCINYSVEFNCKNILSQVQSNYYFGVLFSDCSWFHFTWIYKISPKNAVTMKIVYSHLKKRKLQNVKSLPSPPPLKKPLKTAWSDLSHTFSLLMVSTFQIHLLWIFDKIFRWSANVHAGEK